MSEYSFPETLNNYIKSSDFAQVPDEDKGFAIESFRRSFLQQNNITEKDAIESVNQASKDRYDQYRSHFNIPRFQASGDLFNEMYGVPVIDPKAKAEDKVSAIEKWRDEAKAKISENLPTLKDDADYDVEDFSNNLIRRTLGEDDYKLGGGIPNWISDKTKRALQAVIEPFGNIADFKESQRFMARNLVENPLADEDISSDFVSGFGQLFTQSVIAAGLSFAGAPEAIPYTFGLLYGAQYMNEAYQQEMKRTGNKEQAEQAAVNSLPAAALDTFSDAFLFHGLGKTTDFAKKFTKATTDAEKRALIKEAIPSVRKEILEQSLSEGLIGGAGADVASNLGNYYATGDEKYLENAKDLNKLARSAFVEGTLGTVFGGGHAMLNKGGAQDRVSKILESLTLQQAKSSSILEAIKSKDYQKVIDIVGNKTITSDELDFLREAAKPSESTTFKDAGKTVKESLPEEARNQFENLPYTTYLDKRLKALESDPEANKAEIEKIRTAQSNFFDDKGVPKKFEEKRDFPSSIELLSVEGEPPKQTKEPHDVTLSDGTILKNDNVVYVDANHKGFVKNANLLSLYGGLTLQTSPNGRKIKFKGQSRVYEASQNPKEGLTPILISEKGIKILAPVKDFKKLETDQERADRNEPPSPDQLNNKFTQNQDGTKEGLFTSQEDVDKFLKANKDKFSSVSTINEKGKSIVVRFREKEQTPVIDQKQEAPVEEEKIIDQKKVDEIANKITKKTGNKVESPTLKTPRKKKIAKEVLPIEPVEEIPQDVKEEVLASDLPSNELADTLGITQETVETIRDEKNTPNPVEDTKTIEQRSDESNDQWKLASLESAIQYQRDTIQNSPDESEREAAKKKLDILLPQVKKLKESVKETTDKTIYFDQLEKLLRKGQLKIDNLHDYIKRGFLSEEDLNAFAKEKGFEYNGAYDEFINNWKNTLGKKIESKKEVEQKQEQRRIDQKNRLAVLANELGIDDNITVVNTVSELDEKIQKLVDENDQAFVIDNKHAYFILDQIKPYPNETPIQAVERIFKHEVVGHMKMSKVLEGISPEGFNNLKEFLKTLKYKNGKNIWEDRQSVYPNAKENEIVDEILAKLAEQRTKQDRTILQRIINWIRLNLLKSGQESNWTSQDLEIMLQEAFHIEIGESNKNIRKSKSEQAIRLESSMKGMYGAWITPNGTIDEVNYQDHFGYALEKIGEENATNVDQVYNELYNRGYLRAVNTPSGIFIEGHKLTSAQRAIIDFVGINDEKTIKFNNKTIYQVPSIRFSKLLDFLRDKEYMEAVEAGDMETAQRMVDEAARRAGYDIGPVYHGGIFNKEKDPIFKESERFGQAYFFLDKKQITKKENDNEFIIGGPKWIAMRDKGIVTNAFLSGNFMDTQERVSKELFKKAKQEGFNGIKKQNGNAIEYIVFNPEQIKSAEAIERDNNGNIIPLSQRFNTESPDIRFSKKDTYGENFKSWFGDWENTPEKASKVVNEKGEPLVVYHGTMKNTAWTDGDFTIFYPLSHFGTAAANERINSDVFPEPSSQRLYPVYLNIRNPLEIQDNKKGHKYNDFINEVIKQGFVSSEDADKFIRDYIKDLNQKEIASDDPSNNSLRASIALIRSLGYDGFKYVNNVEDAGSISWVAIYPNQIKSATGNQGTYDYKNPDIRFSKRDSNRIQAGSDFVYTMVPYDPETNKLGKHKLPNTGIIKVSAFKKIGTETGELKDAEIEFYKQIVPEAFNGDDVNIPTLVQGLQEKDPQIETHVYGQDGQTSQAKADSDRIRGEFDIAGIHLGDAPGEWLYQGKVFNTSELPKEFQERAKQLEKITGEDYSDRGPKATSYYNQISPFDTKKFPVVRVDVVLPNYNTSVDNLHTNIKGTVVWSMVQIVPHPRTGKKVAFIAELQSRAAQARRDQMKSLKSSIEQIEDRVKNGNLDRTAADKLIQSQRDAADAIAPDHPVLPFHQSLGLKAVIKWVKEQNQKAIAEGRPEDVIDEVVISDGETAMMTEGHDKAAQQPSFLAEDQTVKISQEGGMRLHYDTTLPSEMRKLTGDKGERVDMGVHKNARKGEVVAPNAQGDGLAFRPNSGEVTGSPVFRNADGTPKSNVTGIAFDISKAVVGPTPLLNVRFSKQDAKQQPEEFDFLLDDTDLQERSKSSSAKEYSKLLKKKLEQKLIIKEKNIWDAFRDIQHSYLDDATLNNLLADLKNFVETRSFSEEPSIDRTSVDDLQNRLIDYKKKANESEYNYWKSKLEHLPDFKSHFEEDIETVRSYVKENMDKGEDAGIQWNDSDYNYLDKITELQFDILDRADDEGDIINRLFTESDVMFEDKGNPHLNGLSELAKAKMNNNKALFAQYLLYLSTIDASQLSRIERRQVYYSLLSIATDGYPNRINTFISNDIDNLLKQTDIEFRNPYSTKKGQLVSKLESNPSQIARLAPNSFAYNALIQLQAPLREGLKLAKMAYESYITPYVESVLKKHYNGVLDKDTGNNIGMYMHLRQRFMTESREQGLKNGIQWLMDSNRNMKIYDKAYENQGQRQQFFLENTLLEGINLEIKDGKIQNELTPDDVTMFHENAKNALGENGIGFADDLVKLFDTLKPLSKFTTEFVYGRTFEEIEYFIPSMSVIVKGDGSMQPDISQFQLTTDNKSIREAKVGFSGINTTGSSTTKDRARSVGNNRTLVLNPQYLADSVGRLAVYDYFTAHQRQEMSRLLNYSTKQGKMLAKFLGDTDQSRGRMQTFRYAINNMWQNEISQATYLHPWHQAMNWMARKRAQNVLSGLYQLPAQALSNTIPYFVQHMNEPHKIGNYFKAMGFWLKYKTGNLNPTQTKLVDSILFEVNHRQQDSALDKSINLGINPSDTVEFFKKHLPFIYNGIRMTDKAIEKVLLFQFRASDMISGAPMMLAEYLNREEARLGRSLSFENLSYDSRSYIAALDDVERYIGIGDNSRRGEFLTNRNAGISLARNLLVAFRSFSINNANNFMMEAGKVISHETSSETRVNSLKYMSGILSQTLVFNGVKIAVQLMLAKAIINALKNPDDEDKLKRLYRKQGESMTKAQRKVLEDEISMLQQIKKTIGKVDERQKDKRIISIATAKDLTSNIFVFCNFDFIPNAVIHIIPDKIYGDEFKQQKEAELKRLNDLLKRNKSIGNDKTVAKLREEIADLQMQEFLPSAFETRSISGIGGSVGGTVEGIIDGLESSSKLFFDMKSMSAVDFLNMAAILGVNQVDLMKLMKAQEKIEEAKAKKDEKARLQ